MNPPLVFISHKHSDRAIANVVRSFVTERTSNKVKVFQSSESGTQAVTPEIGRTLNDELRKALWECKAVILVYTTPDQDWGYCMWECGVATNPESPDTRIIVLQCSDSVPALFSGQVRVNARDKTAIKQFATQFLTSPRFLPGVNDPLTGYERNDPQVESASNKLFDDLQAVIPKEAVAEWPTKPFLQLQLLQSVLKPLADAAPEARTDLARNIVLSHAVVSNSDSKAHALFNMAGLEKGEKLQTLIGLWRERYPKCSDDWVESLVDQVAKAAQRQLPALRWSAMQALDDGQLHVPVLTQVRRLPSISALQFDVYFCPFNLLDATPVASRMVRRGDIYCKVLEPEGEAKIRILELIQELSKNGYTRVPFVSPEDRLIYIAHRSMLDQFVASQVSKGNLSNLEKLTLFDLFSDQPKLREMFEKTSAFVGTQATLGEAKLAMNNTPQCYDVFVTDTGKPNEPLLGWITDIIIAESESAK